MNRLYAIAAGVAVATLSAGGALAADAYYAPSSYDAFAGAFDFEGLYAGIYGGGYVAGTTFATVGIAVGVNMMLTDSIVVGGEFQGGWIGDGVTSTYDALGLARLGVAFSGTAMAYAAGGAGLVDGSAAYALGGGLELSMTDAISLRGEVLGIGDWGGSIETAKLTAGVLLHLD